MILGSGNFVKTAEVNDRDMLTFKDSGDWVENTMYKYPDGNPKVDFIIKVEINGDTKSMRLNKTNREIVIAAYGNDTAKWVGKSATITKEKVLVAGKKHDCILLEIDGVVHTSEEEAPF
uniref:Uncharacterized protein n=1 Tax=viral metagenome TaxID=1070528 RepID=A0A6M3IQ74_9ZZZZ